MKPVPQARLDLADAVICMCGRLRVPDQRLAVSRAHGAVLTQRVPCTARPRGAHT